MQQPSKYHTDIRSDEPMLQQDVYFDDAQHRIQIGQATQECRKCAGHSSSTYGKGLLRAGSDGPRYLTAGN